MQSNTANYYNDDGIANGYNDGLAVTGSTIYSTSQNYLTDAGAYTQSSSFYGTLDQGGNVEEWNETYIGGLDRGLRGGDWADSAITMQSLFESAFNPTGEGSFIGFRVATSVPEPSTSVLVALSALCAGLFVRRHRQSH